MNELKLKLKITRIEETNKRLINLINKIKDRVLIGEEEEESN